jgi:hypothetical protein
MKFLRDLSILIQSTQTFLQKKNAPFKRFVVFLQHFTQTFIAIKHNMCDIYVTNMQKKNKRSIQEICCFFATFYLKSPKKLKKWLS